MESLSRAMLFDEKVPLHTRIRYGCRVLGVHKLDGGENSYQISYDSNGTRLRIRAQFVVMTVPLPQLQNIAFEPPLDLASQKAISDSHYVRAVKIMLQTKSPFWPEQGMDGMLVSDLPIKNTYFVPPFPDSPKGMIIASYVWESGADDEEKIKLAVKNLTEVFPEMEEQYERGAIVEWWDGFCIFTPRQMKEHHDTLRSEVAPNFFLAGEHCSVEHGYFEGALESGLRAVADVFRRIDHTYYARFESFQEYGTHQDRVRIREILLDADASFTSTQSLDPLDLAQVSQESSVGKNLSLSRHADDMSPRFGTMMDCQIGLREGGGRGEGALESSV